MAEADARRRAWLEKAERFLRTAQVARRDDDHDSSVSRAYYAVFYGIVALLPELEDVVRREVANHNTVIDRCVKWNQQHTQLNKVGLLKGRKDLRSSLSRLKSWREDADYRVNSITEETSQYALDFVTRFLETLREIIL